MMGGSKFFRVDLDSECDVAAFYVCVLVCVYFCGCKTYVADVYGDSCVQ